MRALLEIIWKNTQAKSKYDAMITRTIEAHPKMSKWRRVEVALVMQMLQNCNYLACHLARGDEHNSIADPDLRVSGQIFNKEGMRITSGHWYKDGRVVYSKNTSINDLTGREGGFILRSIIQFVGRAICVWICKQRSHDKFHGLFMNFTSSLYTTSLSCFQQEINAIVASE